MDNVQLVELTQEEMMAVDGGQANGLFCAIAGGVMVFSLATGNIAGALMAGVYIGTNRDVCLAL